MSPRPLTQEVQDEIAKADAHARLLKLCGKVQVTIEYQHGDCRSVEVFQPQPSRRVPIKTS